MRIAIALFALLALAPPALARVDVTLDTGSLNDLIANMAPERVPVELAAGRAITLVLHDLEVTGFDPAGGGAGQGYVLTSVRLQVPELGLDVPLTPKLSLQFREANGKKVAYLRFEEVKLVLPVTGPINLAPLLPPLPIIADNAWFVNSARGKIRVEPRLVDARLGTSALRLAFDLIVTPAAAGAASKP